MAVALLGTPTKAEDANSGTITSLTWSHTVDSGSDRCLVVSVASTSDTTHQSVTYDGVSMTSAGSAGAANRRVSQWYLVAPTVGTANVVATLATGSRVIMGFAVTYSGVHQSSTIGTAAGATGDSDAPSVDVTSASGELVVDVVGMQRLTLVEGLTAGANQTSRGEDVATETVVWMQSGVSEEAGAGTTTMSWSSDVSDVWAIQGVPLKPAAATGARNMLLLGVG